MLIELPIVLLIVLPIVLPIALPIAYCIAWYRLVLSDPSQMGRGSWAGPARFWLGGVGRGVGGGGGGAGGSWAGPVWFWLGGPRVLGRAGLVLNTLKNPDSDEDVNIIRRRTMTVTGPI